MADNKTPAGVAFKVATRETTYSGETADIQAVSLVTVAGSDDAKTATDVSTSNRLPTDATNAGTFATQVDGAALTALQLIDDPVFADDAAFTVGTSKVMVAGANTVAIGSDPDAADAGDAGAFLANRHRVQFVIGGHPNVTTVKHTNITTAVTDTAMGPTIGTGTKLGISDCVDRVWRDDHTDNDWRPGGAWRRTRWRRIHDWRRLGRYRARRGRRRITHHDDRQRDRERRSSNVLLLYASVIMGVLTFSAGTTAFVAKVRNNRVRLWGGGGAGGGATGNPAAAGGGAGGQFVTSRRALTPGTSYNVVAAAAATGTTTTTVNGNDSTFNATDVVAKGGAGGVGNSLTTTNGGAGSTTGGVGDTVTAGGNGANAASTSAGGGGGGGGGGNASGQTGGTATAPGGNGATSAAGAGAAGSVAGGGGAGGQATNATDRAGGNGAAGQGIIDWVPAGSLMMLGVG